jgi:hypothetical protein
MARKIQIVAAALCAVAFPSLGIAQSEHSLVGTWKLVSFHLGLTKVTSTKRPMARIPRDSSPTRLRAG